MANREDIIEEKTFPELGFGEDLSKRVFYVLNHENDRIRNHRTMRSISNLIALLHHKKMLTEDEVEEFLFDLVF